MKIWAYCTIWNEEKMLDFYLKYYSQFCEKIVFFDNESNDDSHKIINSYPNTEIRTFKTGGKLDDAKHIYLKSKAVVEAAGNCDYVIITDCDEFVYHPNLIQFLEENLNKISIFYPAGFQMVSRDFPNKDLQIFDSLYRGVPDPWYSKPVLLNPNMVENFNWVEGCHDLDIERTQFKGKIHHPIPEEQRPNGSYKGNPWGSFEMLFEKLDLFEGEPLKLLHYKYLGEDYVKGRYRQYINRSGESNEENGLGHHYEEPLKNDSISLEIENLIKQSIKLKL